MELVHIYQGNRICRHRSYTSSNLCTYPTRIEHVGMIEEVERERERDQGHPKEKASLEQVEIKMEDTYHLKKFEERVPMDTTSMYPLIIKMPSYFLYLHNHIFLSYLLCFSPFSHIYILIHIFPYLHFNP